MNWSEALNAVRQGKAVSRKGWEQDRLYLKMFDDKLYIFEIDTGFSLCCIDKPEYYKDIEGWYIIDVPEREVTE